MKIVEMPVINIQDTVAMLRAIADDIESGRSPNARQAVLVIERDEMPTTWQVYDFGLACRDPLRAVGVLHVGIQTMMDKVLGA